MTCNYCGTPTETEWDPETGESYQRNYHWSCISEQADGRFEVVLTHTTSTRAPHVERYTSRKRAVEVAKRYREMNRREWVCGSDLDIVVRERLLAVAS